NAMELVGYRDRAFLKDALSMVLPKTADEKESYSECFDSFFSFKKFETDPPRAEDQESDADGSEEGQDQDGDDAEGGQGAEGRGEGAGGKGGRKSKKKGSAVNEDEDEDLGE